MESWRCGCILAICGLLTGCQAARLTEPLERENRHLEDHLYELQDQLHDLQCQLESCRAENAALRRTAPASGSRDDEFERRTAPPAMEAPSAELGEPTSGMPNSGRSGSPPRMDDAPPFRAPEISPPNPAIPEGTLPDEAPPFTPTPATPQSLILPGESGPALERVKQSVSKIAELVGKEPDRPITDYDVVEVTLNSKLTGGHDRNGVPGDEGVMVVIEPRNRTKQIVPVPAEVSIVVLDPALQGPEARVARWDFTSDEAAEHFKQTAFGNGLHFDLPWPSEPPKQRDLMLFVRYTLPSQQALIVDKPIKVRLLGEPAGVPEGVVSPPVEDAGVDPEDRTAIRGQRQESAVRPAPRRISSEYQGDVTPRQVRRPGAPNAPQVRPGWSRDR